MPADTWRTRSARIIATALANVPATATEQEIRAILKPLYPFGERKYHPYKAWCKAVNDALAVRKLKPLRGDPFPADDGEPDAGTLFENPEATTDDR